MAGPLHRCRGRRAVTRHRTHDLGKENSMARESGPHHRIPPRSATSASASTTGDSRRSGSRPVSVRRAVTMGAATEDPGAALTPGSQRPGRTTASSQASTEDETVPAESRTDRGQEQKEPEGDQASKTSDNTPGGAEETIETKAEPAGSPSSSPTAPAAAPTTVSASRGAPAPSWRRRQRPTITML